VFKYLAPKNTNSDITRKWNDQNLLLQAVVENIEGRGNSFTADGWIGPGYVTAFRLFNSLFPLVDFYENLVRFNQILFILTIFFINITVLFFYFNQRGKTNQNLTILRIFGEAICYLTFLTFIYYFSGIFQYINIPWTNFLATLLWQIVLLQLLLLVESGKFHSIQILSLGFFVFFTYQTRQLDGIILIALSLLFINFYAVKNYSKILNILNMNLIYLLGLLSSFFLTGITTQDLSLFNQYKKIAEVFPGYKSPDFIGMPIRLIQVLIDPCFYSMCRYNDFQPLNEGMNNIWGMPLIFSLPLFLPVVIMGVFALIFSSQFTDKYRILFFTVITSSLIHIFAHFLLPVINGSVMKYGTSREFISGILILSTIFIMAFIDMKSKIRFIVSTIFIASALTIYYLSIYGPLIKLEEKHLQRAQVTLSKSCFTNQGAGIDCKVKIYGINYGNKVWQIRPKGHVKVHNSDQYKWFRTDEAGNLDKEAVRYINNCENCLIDVLPIIVGVNGTPVYDLVQGMFRIYPGYNYSLP
jgi:hypothetical protein